MQAIVGAALRQRILVMILSVAVIAGGLFAYSNLNIEAYPDPVPPLVDIVTQNPGQSSDEMERYITIPIEVQMAGLPFVKSIRTISLTGLSGREGPVHLRPLLRPGVADGGQPPVAARALAQRRAAHHLADQPDRRDLPLSRRRARRLHRHRPENHPGLVLLRRLKSVPGVIDVTTWGGKSKTYDITVDLDKLLAYGVTLKQVLDALTGANINVGANTINLGPQSAVIRSVGQIRTMDDIRHTMLTVRDGAPVLVSDFATISVGHEPRLGVAGHDDDDDVVQGIVLMRRGAKTMQTLRLVEAEVDKINSSDLCRRACASSASTIAASWSTSPPAPSCTTW
jgi:cobalt-zinc-cadmium resistance protein CzcA